jgi:hypothetical protein
MGFGPVQTGRRFAFLIQLARALPFPFLHFLSAAAWRPVGPPKTGKTAGGVSSTQLTLIETVALELPFSS